MNTRIIPIALLATAAAAGFSQSVGSPDYTPPYRIVLAGGFFPAGGRLFRDVTGVHGLPISKLLLKAAVQQGSSLQTGPAAQNTALGAVAPAGGANSKVSTVPRTEFSFTREWTGEPGPSLAVAGAAGFSGSTATATIAMNSTATVAAPPFAMQLGNVQYTEWVLFAENNVVVAESVRFTYNTKQIIPVLPVKE